MFFRNFYELIQISELFRLLGVKTVCTPEIPHLPSWPFFRFCSTISTIHQTCNELLHIISESNLSLSFFDLRETPMRLLHHRSADRACLVFLRVPTYPLFGTIKLLYCTFHRYSLHPASAQ